MKQFQCFLVGSACVLSLHDKSMYLNQMNDWQSFKEVSQAISWHQEVSGPSLRLIGV